MFKTKQESNKHINHFSDVPIKDMNEEYKTTLYCIEWNKTCFSR